MLELDDSNRWEGQKSHPVLELLKVQERELI